MATPISTRETRLVVGISSRALFDLTVEDALYQKLGLDAYEQHSLAREDHPQVSSW